jgi:predicted enzyme related to lactoylglutathione lyase
MTSRLTQFTLDVADPERMATFWSQALGYRSVPDEGPSIHLVPADDGRSDLPTMWLQPVSERKAGKNRCHPDLEADDPDEEVERLVALGATRADVGQTGDEGFVVLADPEGNEFCVLGAHASVTDRPVLLG